MIAWIGQHYGWSRADLDALTPADMDHYGGAMAALLERQKEQG